MSGVTIEQQGFMFVTECLRHYWGECLFGFLYLITVFASLLGKRKKEARLQLGFLLFLALTVYNPVLVRYVIPKLGMGSDYYRFFWILPVVPTLAYWCVKLVFSVRKKAAAALAAVGIAALLMVAGTPLKGVVQNFSLIENIYKIPDDLRSVCSVIHQDSEEEDPVVVFDQSYNYLVRQYDASFKLSLRRDAVLVRAGSTSVSVNTEGKLYKRQKIIMDVLYYEQTVRRSRFKKALKKLHVDYIVVPLSSNMHEYLRKCGCTAVAQTEKRIVYRVPAE